MGRPAVRLATRPSWRAPTVVKLACLLLDPLTKPLDELPELDPVVASEAETEVMPVVVAVEFAAPPPHEAASRTAVALARVRVMAASGYQRKRQAPTAQRTGVG